jgi:hypothetical protein
MTYSTSRPGENEIERLDDLADRFYEEGEPGLAAEAHQAASDLAAENEEDLATDPPQGMEFTSPESDLDEEW